MIIYLIRNTANGMCYVGKTTRTLKARWRQHCTEARIARYDWPLYRDMRNFQPHCFELEILGEAKSQRRLNQMERKFIRIFNAVESGYNQACCSFGGRSRKPVRSLRAPLTEEHRQRIAASVRRAHAAQKAGK